MTEGEIRKTIVVDAPPEVVFKALTDEKELVQWMRQEARMDPSSWWGIRIQVPLGRERGELYFRRHYQSTDEL